MFHIRPNIAFKVSINKPTHEFPKEAHFEAIYKIIRYLKGSSDRDIFFKKSESNDIKIFTDADCASSLKDR